MRAKQKQEYLDIHEISARLLLSEDQVRELVRKGEIPGGRIDGRNSVKVESRAFSRFWRDRRESLG